MIGEFPFLVSINWTKSLDKNWVNIYWIKHNRWLWYPGGDHELYFPFLFNKIIHTTSMKFLLFNVGMNNSQKTLWNWSASSCYREMERSFIFACLAWNWCGVWINNKLEMHLKVCFANYFFVNNSLFTKQCFVHSYPSHFPLLISYLPF